MRIDRWRLFNKRGSNLNPYLDTFLSLEFITDVNNARGASGYAITDPCSYITDTVISSGGWNYPPDVEVKLSYTFGDFSRVLTPAEASVMLVDVSVFDPFGRNSKSIGSVVIDVSTQFIYPSLNISSAIFLNPISVGLVETETISILEESSTGKFIRPYDPSGVLVFRFENGDKEIKLFTVDADKGEIIWVDEMIFDVSNYVENTPLIINIGFRSEDDGVFERRLKIYHRINNDDFPLGEIICNAQSIGEDERFNTLIEDFGLPQPKSIYKIFKEADINEDLPDWELINYKSKHIILEGHNIMSYIGSYKGLVNAIKWLGYEDIKIKEWFLNSKDSTKLSLYVPYEAKDRSKTILSFSPEERKNLKKLNQLSLIYCITRDTGEVDKWGNPITENCYQYNINEILVKLKSLKDWLEKNIIGVNARITDITGEGIYYERFRNLIYATQNKGQRAIFSQSLTPMFLYPQSQLYHGEASIGLTIKELTYTKIGKYSGLKIGDFLQYYWDPSNLAFSPDSSSLLFYDPSTLLVGASFRFPLYQLSDIQWVASVEKTESGVLPECFITNPLHIYQNDIRFYNIFDTSAVFYDLSTGLNIYIEKGYIRDSSNDIWDESIEYSIYDGSNGEYIVESSTGIIYRTNGYVNLRPGVNSRLEYSYDDNYGVPLLSFTNYKFTDSSGSTFYFPTDKKYYLDIADGKIAMRRFLECPSSYTLDPSTVMYKREDYYINFTYDSSLDSQKITLNVVYSSPRAPLYIYDPSVYYHISPEESLVFDNSTYIMEVNHTGKYKIEIFGWDTQNNVYRNFLRDSYIVWNKFPKIYLYSSKILDPSSQIVSPEDISTLLSSNKYPVFDRITPLYGLTLNKDIDGNYYVKIPSISYFVDLPDAGSIGRFYNMTERVLSRVGDIFYIDRDYQEFYVGDRVNIILFDRGRYSIVDSTTGIVSSISGDSLEIPGISSYFTPDSQMALYLLNDTERETYNPINSFNDKTVLIDISTYRFKNNQLVGIIINDVCTGYSWGSSFRTIDSSSVNDPSYGFRHLLQGGIPEFVIVNSSRYKITAKHSFSEFSDFTIDISSAKEISNQFYIYLDDKYNLQYYLDNTFAFYSTDFQHDKVLDQWYDVSTDASLISGNFYYINSPVVIEPSTLLILDSYYDPSDYLLDTNTIWTVRDRVDGKVLFRAYNRSVPFIYVDSGIWDVMIEVYDRYGNLKKNYTEGLITVRNG